MQLFRTEAFDTPEKVLPRAAQLAAGIGGIYLLFTVVATIALMIAGMGLFDAVAHAMTGIATGGYSTRDTSLATFGPGVQWVMVVVMILGSLPFVYYIDAMRGRPRPLLRDSQVHWFLSILGGAILVVLVWLWLVDGTSLVTAATSATFNVTSVMTGSGFASADFGTWGGLPAVVLLMVMFIGGCAGSTTCGIKVFRFQVAYAVGRVQIQKLMQPNGVFIPYYNRRPISDEVAASVMAFFFLFVVSFAALAVLLGLFGLDFVTAISGAATAISNVGPGLGPVIGPSGSFATLPDSAKWALSAGMLLGRLEIFTVLILFAPSFWRG